MKFSLFFTFSDKVKNAANATLLSLMFLAIYSQYVVSDPFERIGPTMVFIFMLVGRLVIYYQVGDFLDFREHPKITSKSFFKIYLQIYRKEQQLLNASSTQANGLKQD